MENVNAFNHFQKMNRMFVSKHVSIQNIMLMEFVSYANNFKFIISQKRYVNAPTVTSKAPIFRIKDVSSYVKIINMKKTVLAILAILTKSSLKEYVSVNKILGELMDRASWHVNRRITSKTEIVYLANKTNIIMKIKKYVNVNQLIWWVLSMRMFDACANVHRIKNNIMKNVNVRKGMDTITNRNALSAKKNLILNWEDVITARWIHLLANNNASVYKIML